MTCDLSTLTLAEASALEQIALAAQIRLNARREDYEGRLVQAEKGSRYEAEIIGHLIDTKALSAAASRFYIAAQSRSREADRERCIAIRMIEAFAMGSLRTCERYERRDAA